jgi:hypothetical protein
VNNAVQQGLTNASSFVASQQNLSKSEGSAAGTNDLAKTLLDGAANTVKASDAGAAQVANANITLTGGTVGNWYYADITPVTLTSGNNYRLVTNVTSGGQNYSSASIVITPFGISNVSATAARIYKSPMCL